MSDCFDHSCDAFDSYDNDGDDGTYINYNARADWLCKQIPKENHIILKNVCFNFINFKKTIKSYGYSINICLHENHPQLYEFLGKTHNELHGNKYSMIELQKIINKNYMPERDPCFTKILKSSYPQNLGDIIEYDSTNYSPINKWEHGYSFNININSNLRPQNVDTYYLYKNYKHNRDINIKELDNGISTYEGTESKRGNIHIAFIKNTQKHKIPVYIDEIHPLWKFTTVHTAIYPKYHTTSQIINVNSLKFIFTHLQFI